MTFTPRENLAECLSGGEPEWIPFTLDIGGLPGFSSTITGLFENMTGEKEPAEYFDYDLRIVSISLKRPDNSITYYHDVPVDTVFDAWGIGHWTGGDKDTCDHLFPPFVSCENPGDILSYPEPVLDIEGIAAKTHAFHIRGYPVIGYAGSIYEWAWWLRGMERFMTDLLVDRNMTEALLDKTADFTLRLALASAAQGIDILAFYDDAGMQTGLQISPRLWRELVKPRWDKILSAVRNRHPETIFFFHSCGDVTAIIDDIVEVGFHILHPVQPECMDPTGIKQRYGSRITLCGVIGAQRIFSFGSPDDIRAETSAIMDSLGFDKRCIVCPSNIIQPETPWENILAFAHTARNHRGGKYALNSIH